MIIRLEPTSSSSKTTTDNEHFFFPQLKYKRRAEQQKLQKDQEIVTYICANMELCSTI